MLKYLDIESNGARINSEGLAFGSLTRIEVMKCIKRKVIELRLPVLDRKWDRVDLNKLSLKERRLNYDEKCFKLFDIGEKPLDLIKNKGIELSKTYIYNSHNRWVKRESIKEKDIQRDLERNI